jgi:hypothetical protein
MPDRLLTLPAVAAAIQLNVADVRRLIHSGRLKAKQLIGRGTGHRPRLRVLESALNEFIEAMPDVPVDEPTHRRVRPRRQTMPKEFAVNKNYY